MTNVLAAGQTLSATLQQVYVIDYACIELLSIRNRLCLTFRLFTIYKFNVIALLNICCSRRLQGTFMNFIKPLVYVVKMIVFSGDTIIVFLGKSNYFYLRFNIKMN